MSKSENAMFAYNDLAAGGTSDKVYILNLDRTTTGLCSVVAQYGRRGGTMTVDNKTKAGLLNYEAAKALFDRECKKRITKGYVRLALTPSAVRSAPVMPPSALAASARAAAREEIAPRSQELLTEIDSFECARLVHSDAYYMQDKSDGHSRGVVKIGGEIFGLNKIGRRVPLSAALHAELAQIDLSTFQIDAELVGEKLVCRDLLHADADLHALPYEERFKRLVEVLLESDLMYPVETWEGTANKSAALKRQLELLREGVVFKLRSAPHRAGRNGQHKKFKFIKTLSAIAGEPRATGKDSVEIFLLEKSKKIRVGTVSLIGKPRVREGEVIEVAYLYAFPSKMLSQARMTAKRDDVQPCECTTRQLVYKGAE